MKHQTYKQLADDGQYMRVLCHQCSWAIEYLWQDGEMKTVPGEDVKGYRRISHGEATLAANAAAQAGMTRWDRPQMERLMTQANEEGHHWCLNRDCDGTGDGSCGVSFQVENEVTT